MLDLICDRVCSSKISCLVHKMDSNGTDAGKCNWGRFKYQVLCNNDQDIMNLKYQFVLNQNSNNAIFHHLRRMK